MWGVDLGWAKDEAIAPKSANSNRQWRAKVTRKMYV